MDIERMVLRGRVDIPVEEADVQAVVQQATAAFASREGERLLSYHEFLLQQLRMTRKRWWALQAVLLMAAWLLMESAGEAPYVRSSLGIIAALFVILMLPDLWKNLSNRCMEVEMTSFYSLRRIYAARVLLFGVADLAILAVFCGCSCAFLGASPENLVSDFLLPLTVTAGICFFVLGSQRLGMGGVIGACAAWCALWWLVVANEALYSMIALPLWIAAFGFACAFLAYAIYRLLATCDRFWEVNVHGVVFE